MPRWGLRLILGLAGLAIAATGLWVWQTHLDPGPSQAGPGDPVRGAYLARIGNCAGCHTAPGGAPLAGGRSIATPFGTVYSSNLTPAPGTGLGAWSADDFWRALHLGQSRDGHLLTPAFPYENTSLISRADADDLWAWLRDQPAVESPNRPHELRLFTGSQWALAAWRALYFRPPASGSTDLGRGAYLAQGLAHCSACHGRRDGLAGTVGTDRFEGNLMPGSGWWAPSLHDPEEGGVQTWPPERVRRWLREGQADQHAALGPMAEVVLGSTQGLNDTDLDALARYLQTLPTQAVERPRAAKPDPVRRERGAGLYRDHCAACHGPQGQGGQTETGETAYPALAGHRTVIQGQPYNLLRIIERGGFSPATAGHPRPFGMPPFAGRFDAQELAALMSYLRESFGNHAGEVDEVTVLRLQARDPGS